MFDNSLLLEIASRASNLVERTLIVQKLANNQGQIIFTTDISPFDYWNIKKLSGKLSGQLIKDSYQRGTVNISIIDDLQKLLLDYKLYQLNLHQLSDDQKLEFTKPHIKWLQVYQAALLTLDLPRDNFYVTDWYEPEIYYGNFAKVCEPFLRLIQNELQSLCDAVNVSPDQYKINPQVVTDIQLQFLNRFDMSLAWALEADINVYCSRNQITKAPDAVDAYIDYLEKTFKNKQDYHCFYYKFPVLAKTLAQATKFICDFGEELIQRLTSDANEISTTFFGNKQLSQIKSFNLGKSDYHAGGKSVVIVELELDNSELATIVYKPRCIKSEAAMQGLLAALAKNKVVEFASYQVLCKDGYGYAEFIPSNRTYVQEEEKIQRFYQQLGGYLGIFHILGGSDLHYENILVADGNAFICDCETVLEVVPPGRDLFSDTVFDSVFKTALLAWPRDNASDNSIDTNISGYSGGESYQIPFAIPTINQHRMSLALAVEHQVGVFVELEATNRIYYNGQLVRPQDYKNCIVEGFNQVYDWFQENSTTAITLITELFTPSLVRFINWGTEAYGKLIVSARHPKCLAEPLEVDLLFHSLIVHRRQWDKEGKLADLELAGMWQLDIPLFTAKATSCDELIYNYQQSLPETLAISPLDNAIRRIQKLSSENRNRQNHYIYTSLSTEEINSPHFIAAAVNYAQQIALQLCEMLQPPSSKAPWTNYEFTALGKRQVNIRGDLYDGTAGICLFLAYLDAIQPQPEFRQVAERSLLYSIEQRNTTLIGAFQGETGLIYLLTHLAQLWNQPQLLDLAVELTDELIPRISQDHYFDILHGVAGIIPVMLSLAEATSGKGIDCAHLCAQHLLQHAICQGNTLSWRHHQQGNVQGNLTGFSHGAGGIGWALILLGCHTNQPEYIEAGRQAFAYEATQFDAVHLDWYDLRTSVMTADPNEPHFANAWCNGAAGIGLSRIASWATLGKTDDDILSDAYRALNATLRNFQALGNDTLCHGKAGNAELLLRFSLLRNEPSFQMEANVQAQAQWHNFEKARCWICGTGGNDISPDLMLGLAGIGMHFLRLAYPQRVPSPLLLDPPPK
ncbi:type 2 lanthipeptide synthetase LanM family protein [Cylindrospermum sp. FACHB-282]|uniref:type 2 lanthipeptide synthetase LanM family protein n=1 Tax=Cylindrospermum sp. FACHB-282 TaxID=2692794 RepID=UPI001686016B|nr:type 2 lanthipeptide synthetase LanM family protein [Cylindrospermum sp. FACHB-282]MBD2383910.1 type 2 lantipeptide synthetase LanM [Cylindrospermum sp. FACHB-282]